MLVKPAPRSRLSRDERERQILASAYSLFAERGYGAVTMDDVAERVGVTKPLLYAYLGNKERLYIACMRPAGDAMLAAVGDAVSGASDPVGALRDGLRAFFGFVEADRDAWRVLFDETLPAGGEIAIQVGEYRERLLRLVAESQLARLSPRRRARAALETEARAAAVLGASEALVRWWLRTGAMSASAAAELLIATVEPGLRSLGARAADAPNAQGGVEVREATRRVAVLGGNRIPFARSNSAYASASNQDMLTAALDGLCERFVLAGERLGEVAAGAVLKHSRDFNLTRESVLGSRLAHETPAYDVQQACGTGLEAAILVANKIALGQIESAIAGGVDTTSDAPLAVNEDLRAVLLAANRAKSAQARLLTLGKLRPQHLVPAIPRNEEPRTGLSMGEHQARTTARWKVTREAQDELALRSHLNLATAYERGFQDDLVTPYRGLPRDENLRPDSTLQALAKLKPVFGGPSGTMTAANSTPLSDGAAVALFSSEDWARERGLQVLAYMVEAETAAVDYVGGDEGLLMAPAHAVPRMLARAGLTLADFDLYEIHEAFASQVLCTLAAWEDEDFCRGRLGLDAALGSIDRDKLNVNGGSLAAGHPFAATGGRIVAGLAKALYERGGGRGLISVCAAGGQGVVAILEAPRDGGGSR